VLYYSGMHSPVPIGKVQNFNTMLYSNLNLHQDSRLSKLVMGPFFRGILFHQKASFLVFRHS